MHINLRKAQTLHTILIIGVGALGKRYLEGLMELEIPIDIWLVDISTKSLDSTRDFARQINKYNHRISFTSSINEVPNKIDLAIVSTSADVRAAVVAELSKHSKVDYFILEKVLAQSIPELDLLIERTTQSKGVWVNLPRRIMPWYKSMGISIAGVGSIKAHKKGKNWGLACNAIHYIDLICWWTNEKLMEIDTRELFNIWVESKRPGFFEISGSLTARFSRGSELKLTVGDDVCEEIFVVNCGINNLVIDEVRGIAMDQKGLELKGLLEYQSKITARVVESIITKGTCGLTNLLESITMHKILLNSLQLHWNDNSFTNLNKLPIT